MAGLGFDVLGVDADPGKIGQLNGGRLPIYEPGLRALLRVGLDSGRLTFTTSYPSAAAFGDVHFICVGTPPQPGSDHADLTQVHGCVAALASLLHRPCLVAGKSTVPVGTARRLAAELARAGEGVPRSPTTPGSYLRLYPDRVPDSYAGVTAFTTATGVKPRVVLCYSGWLEPFHGIIGWDRSGACLSSPG
jgi:UDP-N-acetyl-D-mannosaminuronate dehydrogenase